MKRKLKGLSSKLFAGVCILLAGPNLPAQDQGSLGAEVDFILNAATERGDFSGSVLVEMNGDVVLAKGYGFANLELEVPNSTNLSRWNRALNNHELISMAARLNQR